MNPTLDSNRGNAPYRKSLPIPIKRVLKVIGQYNWGNIEDDLFIMTVSPTNILC
jgi:hypothetical protein